jgi:hypothetical protein
VEQLTKLRFVINLKTAKQIGLTIPQTVLYQPDRVIKRISRSKLAGYQFKRIYPKVVTPECFYQGSGQNFAWIPNRSVWE